MKPNELINGVSTGGDAHDEPSCDHLSCADVRREQLGSTQALHSFRRCWRCEQREPVASNVSSDSSARL